MRGLEKHYFALFCIAAAEHLTSCVQDVNELPAKHFDSMPTHMTGQTLKYLWLLFGRDPLYSVGSGWIFNLEGHPFKY